MARKLHYVEPGRSAESAGLCAPGKPGVTSGPRGSRPRPPYGDFSASPRAVLFLLTAFAVFMLIASLV